MNRVTCLRKSRKICRPICTAVNFWVQTQSREKDFWHDCKKRAPNPHVWSLTRAVELPVRLAITPIRKTFFRLEVNYRMVPCGLLDLSKSNRHQPQRKCALIVIISSIVKSINWPIYLNFKPVLKNQYIAILIQIFLLTIRLKFARIGLVLCGFWTTLSD